MPTRDFGSRIEQKGLPDELEFVVRVDGLVRGDGGVEGCLADEAPGADGVAVHVDCKFGHGGRLVVGLGGWEVVVVWLLITVRRRLVQSCLSPLNEIRNHRQARHKRVRGVGVVAIGVN